MEKTFHNKKLCRKKEELYKRGNRSLVPPSETGRGLALPQHSFDSARPDPSLTHRPHPPHSFPSRCRWPLQPQLPKPSQTNQTNKATTPGGPHPAAAANQSFGLVSTQHLGFPLRPLRPGCARVPRAHPWPRARLPLPSSPPAAPRRAARSPTQRHATPLGR